MSERNKGILKDVISYALIILIVVVIRVFIFDPVRVDGPSMNNTLIDGDIVILNKFEYRKKDPERYDIVVIKITDPTTNSEKKIIKRVIGLPNEYIEIKDNKVYANGELLDSSFVSKDLNKSEDFKLEDLGLKKIPGDSYLVLGDNRRDSFDSRYKEVGTIKRDQIVGKAAIRIWPINKIKIIKHK
ncbi:MAG: signal peptidase I [Bacilli bacterium]|nr:signal peptidase I [Bacilli bacterium]